MFILISVVIPTHKRGDIVVKAVENEIIKKSVVKTRGHRPREREVSGHSLRVGAAQDLMMMGHDLPAIMRAGGWNNIRVVSRYLQMSEHNIWDQ